MGEAQDSAQHSRRRRGTKPKTSAPNTYGDGEATGTSPNTYGDGAVTNRAYYYFVGG